MDLKHNYIQGIIIFLLFSIPVGLSAQPFWNRTYGGVGDDAALSVVQTADFGYLMAGLTGSYGEGASDAYLLKTDSLGNFLWYKTYGGSNVDVAQKIIQVPSGGYFVAGYSNSQTLDYDFWMFRIDEVGDTLWTRKIGGADWDRAYSVVTNNNEEYFIVGETYSGNNQFSDGLIIKLDSVGNTLWQKSLTLAGNNALKDIIRISDTRYAAVGTVEQGTAQTTDGFVLFFDGDGNFLDTVYYHFGFDEYLNCMAVSPAAEIMLGGYYTYDETGFPKSIQIKIDSTGGIIFQLLAGIADDFGMHILSYGHYDNDIFFFCGRSSYKSSGDHQAVVLKSYDTGYPEWLRSYGLLGPDDGVDAVIKAYDGGFLSVGFTKSYGPGTQALLMFKIAPNGDFHTSNTMVSIDESQLANDKVAIFPNPVQGQFICKSEHIFSLRLMDANGRTVINNLNNSNQYEVNTEQFPTGVYFVEMRFGDGSVRFEKIYIHSK